MPLFNRQNGIYLERRKATKDMAIVPITLPDRVFIPMTQGDCPASVPCVEPGDKVTVGQLIGRAKDKRAVPVHSSVSGTVVSVAPRMSQYGYSDLHIEIETDGKQSVLPQLAPPVVDGRQSFLDAVRNSGLVGLGSFGVPTAEKLAAEGLSLLIVNAAECEPYLACDYRNTLAFPKDAVLGAADIMKWLGIGRCIIAVGADKQDAAALLKKESADLEGIEITMLSAIYPSGEERTLIRELTGKEMQPGVSPADLGIAVLNVSTVIRLRQYLVTGMPLVSRSLTVSGACVASPMNVEAPVGTLFSDVLAFCKADLSNAGKLTVSGPMTGAALPSADYPVIKTNNAALLFPTQHAARDKETACINCGQCVRACPAGLVPVVLMKAWQKKSAEALLKHRIFACVSCGSCSYVCPARRQLSFELSMAAAWTQQQLNNTPEECHE